MTWKTAEICRSEIGGQTVIFTEETQKLAALNEAAIILWERLEAGLPIDGLIGDGTHQRAVSSLLSAWARNGFIRSAEAFAEETGSSAVPAHRIIEIGLARVGLSFEAGLAASLWRHFAHFESPRRKPEVELRVQPDDPWLTDATRVRRTQARVRLSRQGRILQSCAQDEVLPALRGQLVTEVLDHGAYALALHAAGLVCDGQLALITGPPGSGKSTLTMGLLGAGFGCYAADDLVLLDGDGVARGIPLWPGLKEGAWALLAGLRPDLAARPTHRRPDGRTVRYLPPRAPISAARHPVGWVIVLSDEHRDSGLTPIEPLRAFEALLAGAFTPDDRLSNEGFRALARLVQDARCFSISRLPLVEAIAAVIRVCR